MRGGGGKGGFAIEGGKYSRLVSTELTTTAIEAKIYFFFFFFLLPYSTTYIQYILYLQGLVGVLVSKCQTTSPHDK